MQENFSQLFEASLVAFPMVSGAVVDATVERITDKHVIVDAGLKSESYVPIDQFQNEQGILEVAVGDTVKVALDVVEDGFGNTRLSRERAKRLESWATLETAYANKETVRGTVVGRVRGGFTVEINKVRAFLPGSLVDTKPVRDPEAFEGKEFEFKVIKVDTKRNNIVLSRRAVLEAENTVERAAVLENIKEGDEVKGVVKNLTDYGAFVDLGGVDGLLHITDMSWKRVKHPSEILNIGDEIKVRVLKIDRQSARVSLGLKQLAGDPWADVAARYPVAAKLSGKVTNITDYGCFVELEEGIEGLVHVSEMDWTNKNVNPNKVVFLSQSVDVIVLDVDADRRRISLGIKQCVANPWAAFSDKHEKGERVKGKIKSITDFGIFLELDGAIDGLIYLSDIAWSETEAQDALRKYQKGDELEAVILSIDVERERIALGLKQLVDDPVANYLEAHEKGQSVSGQIVEVEAKHLVVELAEGVRGILRSNELAEKVEDCTTKFKVGDTLESKVAGADKKIHAVALSLKMKEVSADKKSSKSTKKKAEVVEEAPKATLGDIFKSQISGGSDK